MKTRNMIALVAVVMVLLASCEATTPIEEDLTLQVANMHFHPTAMAEAASKC